MAQAIENSSEPLIRVRTRPRSSTAKRLAVGTIVLLGAAALVVAFVYFRGRLAGPARENTSSAVEKITGEVRNSKNQDEKAFQISMPKKVWKLDAALANRLKGSGSAIKGATAVALARRDSSGQSAAWLAVLARDFGFHRPREAALTKEAIDRLENVFGETLELAEKTQATEFAGQRARALEFTGTFKQVVWQGEMLMMTRHGLGVWAVIAAPTLAEAQQITSELGDGRNFALVDERAGWREQPPKSVSFNAAATLTVTAPEGVWEKKDATQADERGILLLYGRYGQEKDNRRNAQVLFVRLDRADDSLSTVRAYFENERKKDNKDYQFDPSGSGKIGEREIDFVELKMRLGTEAARYFLIAAIPEGGHTIGILCESTWESRQIWRPDFLALLKTLKTDTAE